MRTLKFYGVSDDLFEVEGSRSGEPDEINALGDTVELTITRGTGGNTEGLIVFGSYLGTGVWGVGVAPLDEGKPFPDWAKHFTLNDRGYSTELQMLAPDDCTICEL